MVRLCADVHVKDRVSGMPEEPKPPTEENNPKPPAPEPAPAPPPSDVKVPKGFVMISEGEFAGYRTKGKQLSELEKYKADKEAEAQKAAEEALARQGKHEKIIGDRDKEIADLRSTLAQTQREAVVSRALAGLTDVRSINARERMAEKWATKPPEERDIEGAFEAFIEAERKADPGAFDGPGKPVEHAGGAGHVDTGSGSEGDLRSRLNSSDPMVKRAAAFEEARLIADGKLQPGWDQQ